MHSPTMFPQAPGRFPENQHGSCTLRYRNGVPVLTLQGSPEEIGAALGILAVRPAPQMASYPESLLRKFCVPWLHGTLVRAGSRMVERFPDDYRREFEAVVRSSDIARSRMILGNTLFDLKKILACSALLVESSRSATEGPLVGRNLDYPSMGFAHEYSLVTVYCNQFPGPTGQAKYAFATVGFPGLLGCLSGMNEKGLTLAVLEVFQARWFTRRLDRGGLPYALCFRRLLEECATVDEAREMLTKMRRTTLFNLVVADRQRVATLETTPHRVVERPAVQGASLCTNHFCTPELKPGWTINVYKTHNRHRALSQAERTHDRFGLPELHAALHAASKPEQTLQTMIFEPTTLRLHLAFGTCPASAGPLRTVNLGEEFQRE